ncbi:hypothetical protein EV424DRAFT_1346862 [Suillus variegatus]|nr:hypothetical protein EV424DRAFT_1346862 [Suillus variegatus]
MEEYDQISSTEEDYTLLQYTEIRGKCARRSDQGCRGHRMDGWTGARRPRVKRMNAHVKHMRCKTNKLYYVTMFAMIRAWDLYNSYRQLATMSHNAQPHATSTQLSWVNDMMAHVEPDRVSEFSTSGTSGDVSVFWEPDSLCMTDPFVLHAPSPQPPPQWKFPTPSSPSSPTPDVKLSKLSVCNKMGQLLKCQDHAHPNVNIKDPDSVPSINSALSQSQKTVLAALLDKISESQRAAAMLNDEQKDSKRKVVRLYEHKLLETLATLTSGSLMMLTLMMTPTRRIFLLIVPPSSCLHLMLPPSTSVVKKQELNGKEICSKQNEAIIEEMKACTAVLE